MSTALDTVAREPVLFGERYRAKVAFVSPVARRSTFEAEPTCFIGVSLENRNFTPSRFHSIVEWASRRFSRCQVLIGDSIHRITVETTEGFAPDRALAQALDLGETFMAENQVILDKFGDTTELDYVTCSSIQMTEEYAAQHGKLIAFFESNAEFRRSLDSFAQNYHRNEWDVLTDHERRTRLNRSAEYFLEEFAVFACLVRQGVSVMVYPGSFSTLAEIADGALPGAPAELEAMTVVSLQLKRR